MVKVFDLKQKNATLNLRSEFCNLVFKNVRFFEKAAFLQNLIVKITDRLEYWTMFFFLFYKFLFFFSDFLKIVLHAHHGELLLKNQRICTVFYQQSKTGDIVQGIPKIEQLFEARKKLKRRLRLDLFSRDLLSFEKKVTKYLRSLQKSVVNNIQRIYNGQGVHISDKHVEIIVRQMTSNAFIVDPGQTGLLYGEIVPLQWISRLNSYTNHVHVFYEPILIGMTKTCLESHGFLSAASFQETTRILGRAALLNQMDFVRGLKQNIILGNLIPGGTGCFLRIQKNLKQD